VSEITGFVAGGGLLQESASVTISGADWDAGVVTTLIPAPGLNKVIVPLSVDMRYRHGTVGITAAHANTGVVGHDSIWTNDNMNFSSNAADSFSVSLVGTVGAFPFADFANVPMILTPSDAGAGNGSVTVVVHYYVVDLT
jgi:hypothetical protein